MHRVALIRHMGHESLPPETAGLLVRVPVRAVGLARAPAIFLTVLSGYLLLGGLSPGTIGWVHFVF